MQTYKVTLHVDGDPAVLYYPTASSRAHALQQAARYAVKRGLEVVTVEVEEY